MKRTWAILLLMAGAVCPATAATPVTVAQLQQWLDAARGARDGKIAAQLSKLELTERASSAQLAQWMAEFPGKHTREALTELADASAFLDLPEAEIPPDRDPDPKMQHQLLNEAIDYVNKALTKLPNFYATRETIHFEDTLPHQSFESVATAGSARGGSRSMGMAGMTVRETDYQPLHKTVVYSAVVRYRDGAEESAASKERDQHTTGLTTSGEFGPILYIILRDSVAGTITWSHWQKSASGSIAVFRYKVPREESHYKVQMQGAKAAQEIFPAYHGEIALDPVNGTILRLTVMSDLAPPYQAAAADILVEYAPVTIGAHIYVCPVRGVAFSKMPAVQASGEVLSSTLQTQMNEVSFKDYHLFRGDARILSGPIAGGNAASAASDAPDHP